MNVPNAWSKTLLALDISLHRSERCESVYVIARLDLVVPGETIRSHDRQLCIIRIHRGRKQHSSNFSGAMLPDPHSSKLTFKPFGFSTHWKASFKSSNSLSVKGLTDIFKPSDCDCGRDRVECGNRNSLGIRYVGALCR